MSTLQWWHILACSCLLSTCNYVILEILSMVTLKNIRLKCGIRGTPMNVFIGRLLGFEDASEWESSAQAFLARSYCCWGAEKPKTGRQKCLGLIEPHHLEQTVYYQHPHNKKDTVVLRAGSSPSHFQVIEAVQRGSALTGELSLPPLKNKTKQ